MDTSENKEAPKTSPIDELRRPAPAGANHSPGMASGALVSRLSLPEDEQAAFLSRVTVVGEKLGLNSTDALCKWTGLGRSTFSRWQNRQTRISIARASKLIDALDAYSWDPEATRELRDFLASVCRGVLARLHVELRRRNVRVAPVLDALRAAQLLPDDDGSDG